MSKYGDRKYSEVSERHVIEHVWVWENFMGVPVPFDGKFRCHIHHIDGNPSNNDILNLVCMTPSEHHRYENKNKIVSIDTRQKMRENKLGKKFSIERKIQMSEYQKKRYLDPEAKRITSEATKLWWKLRKEKENKS